MFKKCLKVDGMLEPQCKDSSICHPPYLTKHGKARMRGNTSPWPSGQGYENIGPTIAIGAGLSHKELRSKCAISKLVTTK